MKYNISQVNVFGQDGAELSNSTTFEDLDGEIYTIKSGDDQIRVIDIKDNTFNHSLYSYTNLDID